jgi:hypothetical protein
MYYIRDSPGTAVLDVKELGRFVSTVRRPRRENYGCYGLRVQVPLLLRLGFRRDAASLPLKFIKQLEEHVVCCFIAARLLDDHPAPTAARQSASQAPRYPVIELMKLLLVPKLPCGRSRAQLIADHKRSQPL